MNFERERSRTKDKRHTQVRKEDRVFYKLIERLASLFPIHILCQCQIRLEYPNSSWKQQKDQNPSNNIHLNEIVLCCIIFFFDILVLREEEQWLRNLHRQTFQRQLSETYRYCRFVHELKVAYLCLPFLEHWIQNLWQTREWNNGESKPEHKFWTSLTSSQTTPSASGWMLISHSRPLA